MRGPGERHSIGAPPVESDRTPMRTSSDTTAEMELRTDEAAKKKVHEMISKAKFGMLGTYDAQGNAHSRPMVAVHQGDVDEGEGDELWFFTRAESRKVDEIGRDPRVLVDYADDGSQNYVSVVGRAEIVADRARIEALWQEPLRTWFPDGTDDPQARLVKVTADSVEYWDSPSSAMVHAYGYVKARMTGEPPSPGDVAHVKM